MLNKLTQLRFHVAVDVVLIAQSVDFNLMGFVPVKHCSQMQVIPTGDQNIDHAVQGLFDDTVEGIYEYMSYLDSAFIKSIEKDVSSLVVNRVF